MTIQLIQRDSKIQRKGGCWRQKRKKRVKKKLTILCKRTMHYKLSYQLRISNTCSLIRAWSKCNSMRKYFNFNRDGRLGMVTGYSRIICVLNP